MDNVIKKNHKAVFMVLEIFKSNAKSSFGDITNYTMSRNLPFSVR